MSNLTDFFPSSSASGGNIITDPNELIQVTTYDNTLYGQYSGGVYSSDRSQFWSIFNTSGVKTNITAANTYTTLVDVTGSGHFHYAISPSTGAIGTVTAKFTVDGTVTEITTTVNKFNSGTRGRALFGMYLAGHSPSATTTLGWGEFTDNGTVPNNSSFPTNGEYQASGRTIMTPDYFNFPNAPKLRFETDFKLEFKASIYNTTSSNNTCAAHYKMD